MMNTDRGGMSGEVATCSSGSSGGDGIDIEKPGDDPEVISKPFSIRRRATPPNVYIIGTVNGEPNKRVVVCSYNQSVHFKVIIDELLDELNCPTCAISTTS